MKALEYLLNKLTLLYSKIYYEEENYLKVKTEFFIYPSPPYSKGLGMWEYYYYYYLFYLLPNLVPFLGPCRRMPCE